MRKRRDYQMVQSNVRLHPQKSGCSGTSSPPVKAIFAPAGSSTRLSARFLAARKSRLSIIAGEVRLRWLTIDPGEPFAVFHCRRKTRPVEQHGLQLFPVGAAFVQVVKNFGHQCCGCPLTPKMRRRRRPCCHFAERDLLPGATGSDAP